MLKINNITKAYFILSFFILCNSYLITRGIYYLNLLPVVIAIALIVFYRLDNYWILIIVTCPLTIPLSELNFDFEFDMWLPSEPMIFVLFILIFLKHIKGESFDKKIFLHPVTIAIYFSLFWIFITSLTSTMILVSLKYFLSRLWFVTVFYLFAAEFFKSKKNIKIYTWAFMLPMLIVIAYSLKRHIAIGFYDHQKAQSVMNPFFNDHTSYGAVLAMLIPVAGGLVINRSVRPALRVISFAIFSIFILAFLLSYTRAAWISLFIALGILVVILLRIRFVMLLIIFTLAGSYLYGRYTDISRQLSKNTVESSADISQHVKSISNVSSDASNVERLNRWKCAIRMFNEKPVFGWGPGTYKFQYAPFQIKREKTIISTDAGDRGNAHSEYLGPLAESGFFGMLSLIIIVITTIYTGIRNFSTAGNRSLKIISTSMLIGLITYYIHGIMNNFLDMDKTSALFWGFTAGIVAINIFYTGKQEED